MAKAIMVQGTMSNSGKSFITAGLLRVFVQDGFKAAPFKSQNMALNSYITEDGKEMGRAQVMQAEAAGIKPDVRMNPILLKPTTDVGSQVIVNGVSRGNMKASDYFKYKTKLKKDIMDAYKSLAEHNDIIVIEGAGSPAEINLKNDDIVNMGMAEMADCPVLLAGDIDRGGVFAQLYGTVMLLEERERMRIKGVIINKFRGDRRILEPGLKMLEDKINIPVAGVLPFINVDIDDEDSLSPAFEKNEAGEIDIAVIRLPKISNFTDFNVFGYMENVSVRYVSKAKDLKTPDIIMLPGSKNTISDLKWLRENGIENAVLRAYRNGIPVFGICGGYQMLGEKISDPYNVEGGGSINAMGLLPVETVFANEKKTKQVQGRFEDISGFFSCLSGKEFEGYEIHMGESKANGNALSRLSGGKDDGTFGGNAAGTYVHGVFDSTGCAEAIINAICMKKGVKYNKSGFDLKAYKEKQYDILADMVRNSMDMEMVYNIMGIERR